MRCDKMHATITVERCLANQAATAGSWGWMNATPRYPGCKDCETGAAARSGKLDDADIEELKSRVVMADHRPPMPVVSTETPPRWSRGVENEPEDEPENQEEVVMKEHEPGGVSQKTARDSQPVEESPEPKKPMKICIRCKKPRPLDRFARKRKGEDALRPHCYECEKKYQHKYNEKRRAAMAAFEAEQSGKDGMQAEPAPAKEITAPACLQNEDEILANQLLLDFSCYPEVLKEIKRLADHLERPPEVQARFMLKRVMLDLVDRHPKDIEPMIPGYEPMFLGDWPPSDNGDRQCA